MAINTVTLTGNIATQPELRSTNSGFQILEGCIAVNEWSKAENKEIPSFFEFKVLGKRADSISRFVSKGDKISISGRLKQDRWEANDGSKRSKVYVIADEIEFMSKRSEGAPSNRPAQPIAPPPQPPMQPSYYDEDCPF